MRCYNGLEVMKQLQKICRMKLTAKITYAELQTFGSYFTLAFKCAMDLKLFSTSNYAAYYNLRSLHKKLLVKVFAETQKLTLKLDVNEYESLKWLRDSTASRIKLDIYTVAVTRGIFDTLHQHELRISHASNFSKLVTNGG